MNERDIMHPADAKAIQMIKLIPGSEKVISFFIEQGFEKLSRGENLANMIKVSDSSFPLLYQDFQSVVRLIGIREPELYIYNDMYMNAYTYGVTNTFIAVSSGLLERMNRKEVKGIIAHECGHILCRHVLYNTILKTIEEAGYILGLIKRSLMLPIFTALQYWSRKSELSADRCAASIVGEDVYQTVLIKLACGLKEIDQLNGKNGLLEQGKEYERFKRASIWNRLQQEYRVALYSHPQLCCRAMEVDRWKESYAYRHLVSVHNSFKYNIGGVL